MFLRSHKLAALRYLKQTFTFSMGFPGVSGCKECACNAGDLDLIPESGRFPGKGNGEFHGQRSLAGYSPWRLRGWDMTEWLAQNTHLKNKSPFLLTDSSLLKFCDFRCLYCPSDYCEQVSDCLQFCFVVVFLFVCLFYCELRNCFVISGCRENRTLFT